MDELLTLKRQVCFPIYALSREIINHYRPFLDELGLTYPQYLVMMVLWEEELQTVGQLGDKLSLDSGTLTPLLKRLEQKDLIARKRKRGDDRVVEVTLTENGRELHEKVAPIPQKVVEAMGVTSDELVELKQIVMKILAKSNR